MRDITLTLTKFIIPVCMDTVVELGLVGSPYGHMGQSGVGRYFIFYAETLVYYCLSDLGLVFGCSMCILGGGMGVQNTLFYFEHKISPCQCWFRFITPVAHGWPSKWRKKVLLHFCTNHKK